MHIREVELILSLRLRILCILHTEELLTGLSFAPAHILLRCHHNRCIQIGVTHLGTYHIKIQGVIIFHLLLHILRHTQVKGTGIQVCRK